MGCMSCPASLVAENLDLEDLTPSGPSTCSVLTQEPFYAIKCNTDPQVLRTLLPLCSGFDCASMGEISTMLDLGVSPDKVRAGPYLSNGTLMAPTV